MIISDLTSPSSLKHAQRARIMLHAADRLRTLEVARRAGVSWPAVWRWHRHYAEGGVERLRREETPKPGKAPLPSAMVAEALALTCAKPSGGTTIGQGGPKGQGHGPVHHPTHLERPRSAPHRRSGVTRSKDPSFAEKVVCIVGLYIAPAGPCRRPFDRRDMCATVTCDDKRRLAGEPLGRLCSRNSRDHQIPAQVPAQGPAPWPRASRL